MINFNFACKCKILKIYLTLKENESRRWKWFQAIVVYASESGLCEFHE